MSTSRALENGQNESNAAGGTRLVSRRTVVRTGVTAAWSVPLIQVVGAAPALAVSGPKVGISGGQAVWRQNGNGNNVGTNIDVTVPLSNTGTMTVDSITVTLTFSAPLAPEGGAPKGWSVTRAVIGGEVTLTYTTSSAGLGAGKIAAFTCSPQDPDHRGTAGTVTVA